MTDSLKDSMPGVVGDAILDGYTPPDNQDPFSKPDAPFIIKSNTGGIFWDGCSNSICRVLLVDSGGKETMPAVMSLA